MRGRREWAKKLQKEHQGEISGMKRGLSGTAGRTVGVTAAAMSILAFASVATASPSPSIVAVAPFTYLDTSGEPVDQASLHKARVEKFTADLQHDLSQTGGYGAVSVRCAAPTCETMRDRASLLKQARGAGAAILLVGGIHKMSTLVQFMRAEAISTSTGKTVFTRLLTFRGDSDDAWHHSETFLAGQFLASAPRP